jgi:hypothetical protein
LRAGKTGCNPRRGSHASPAQTDPPRLPHRGPQTPAHPCYTDARFSWRPVTVLTYVHTVIVSGAKSLIFVNIACYRDPECLPTIQDLFHKASNPDRIRVGLVLQTMPADGIDIQHDRVRVHHVPATQARGPCWARALGYRLWQGESHVLQIDSHMRFAPDWDARLLRQLAACPSPRPLLTTYPPAYEPPDQILETAPAFLTAKHFDDRGMLIQHGVVGPRPTAPKPTAFIAAGLLFGPSGWMQDAPYDPNLYFHGEEATLALRLWTHGWDLFGPTEPLLWHRYTRHVRPLHWEDDPDWGRLDAASRSRVRQILGMPPSNADTPSDLTGHDLGSVRSREAYRRFSGVDFATQTIAPHARAGDFADPAGTPSFRLGPLTLHRAAWPIYA